MLRDNNILQKISLLFFDNWDFGVIVYWLLFVTRSDGVADVLVHNVLGHYSRYPESSNLLILCISTHRMQFFMDCRILPILIQSLLIIFILYNLRELIILKKLWVHSQIIRGPLLCLQVFCSVSVLDPIIYVILSGPHFYENLLVAALDVRAVSFFGGGIVTRVLKRDSRETVSKVD